METQEFGDFEGFAAGEIGSRVKFCKVCQLKGNGFRERWWATNKLFWRHFLRSNVGKPKQSFASEPLCLDACMPVNHSKFNPSQVGGNEPQEKRGSCTTMALAPSSLETNAFSGIDETLALAFPNPILTNCWSPHKLSTRLSALRSTIETVQWHD